MTESSLFGMYNYLKRTVIPTLSPVVFKADILLSQSILRNRSQVADHFYSVAAFDGWVFTRVLWIRNRRFHFLSVFVIVIILRWSLAQSCRPDSDMNWQRDSCFFPSKSWCRRAQDRDCTEIPYIKLGLTSWILIVCVGEFSTADDIRVCIQQNCMWK